jgi:hypothetical protein
MGKHKSVKIEWALNHIQKLYRLETLVLAPFSKLLTQLDNVARRTLCILGVTAVRNFFKMMS